jgi:site-specific DNA recombinase
LVERRAFIRSFVESIEVSGNEAVLTYSMRGMLDKVTLDKEGVLPTVRYGGRYRT